ncbi:MAG: flagellar export protein FliJ [Pirellulaceae bacterium]|jgi:flagellar FliJ protein|nr:flagellar export protein FliJ [Pirellulaceae bacterium]
MPRFQFRLRTLLKIKVAERDERRLRLRDAQQAEQVLEEQINEIAVAQQATFAAARAGVRGEISVDRVLQTSRYALLLRSQRSHAVEQLRQVHEEVERRRAALLEIDREVKTLEKLRERQRDEFRRAENALEQKMLDEIAVINHAVNGASRV